MPEIIKSKAGSFINIRLSKKGIELIENTPEEINEIVTKWKKN